MDPLTILGLGSSVLGGIGSLFGSGSKQQIPPELKAVYDMLMQRSQQGLSDQTVDDLIRRAKTGLGSEAGALGALTQSRLTRGGAGLGVQEAALGRINKERMRGIGDATISAELADEEAKQSALQQLAQLAPMFGSSEFKSQYGQGFSSLLESGLGMLLNRPGKQNTGGSSSGGNSSFNNYDYRKGYNPYSNVG